MNKKSNRAAPKPGSDPGQQPDTKEAEGTTAKKAEEVTINGIAYRLPDDDGLFAQEPEVEAAIDADIANKGRVEDPILATKDRLIIDGVIRAKSAQKHGVKDVPVRVHDEDLSPEAAMQLRAEKQLLRRNLPLKARKVLLTKLIEKYPGAKLRELGRLVGVSHNTVANAKRRARGQIDQAQSPAKDPKAGGESSAQSGGAAPPSTPLKLALAAAPPEGSAGTPLGTSRPDVEPKVERTTTTDASVERPDAGHDAPLAEVRLAVERLVNSRPYGRRDPGDVRAIADALYRYADSLTKADAVADRSSVA